MHGLTMIGSFEETTVQLICEIRVLINSERKSDSPYWMVSSYTVKTWCLYYMYLVSDSQRERFCLCICCVSFPPFTSYFCHNYVNIMLSLYLLLKYTVNKLCIQQKEDHIYRMLLCSMFNFHC